MNPNNGADELELDDQITEQPLALVQANRQGARQHGASCVWTPNTNANAMTAQPLMPSQQQAPENRIPGPAGRPTNLHNGSGKSSAYGGGSGSGSGWSASEFLSSEWQAGLRLLNLTEFQENHPLLQGNTVHAAASLKQSGIIPKLLLYVVSMQHAHNGESYVKFRDPSGTIGGTFVSDVLSVHQHITRGAVVLLEKVTVLRTPPPHPVHHLCIIAENVVGVIPRQRRSEQQPAAGLPLFNSRTPRGDGGRGRGDVNGTEPCAQVLNDPLKFRDYFQIETRPAMQQVRPPPQQQQQRTAPRLPPEQPAAATYVQPQIDTADDLLDGLDDEFGF